MSSRSSLATPQPLSASINTLFTDRNANVRKQHVIPSLKTASHTHETSDESLSDSTEQGRFPHPAERTQANGLSLSSLSLYSLKYISGAAERSVQNTGVSNPSEASFATPRQLSSDEFEPNFNRAPLT